MKINPEQTSALKADADRDARKVNKSGERFEDLLFRASRNGASPQDSLSPAVSQPSGPMSPMHLTPTQMLFPVENAPAFQSKAMDTFDNLLSRWENYAHQLSADPQGLRNANGILEEISEQIGTLKANWPQQGSSQPLGPELRGMLDELEVMAVTERIKFNRGDYL
ncbi:hypothetical protein SAMN05660653_00818 [Desulfonatronum thiosulfatophilum]|uniref:Uncharacterized protein n=1 Tax=Desulfonatronum thiosulfatophilum TaxID=617002 RepID=A0A1G6B9I8_9BACT|nr:hypothetical protein [Desulfonatronum thiosulfatophilum]SDB17274.1 hypothetical protein SAMN05660653_00818 [Desulfonatronum thiosulfatophilum]